MLIQPISGPTEAALVWRGVADHVDLSPRSLIMDIGGGSTEFIITQDRPGDPIDVTFDPPHAFEFVLDDHVNPSTSWTGRSANPGL